MESKGGKVSAPAAAARACGRALPIVFRGVQRRRRLRLSRRDNLAQPFIAEPADAVRRTRYGRAARFGSSHAKRAQGRQLLAKPCGPELVPCRSTARTGFLNEHFRFDHVQIFGSHEAAAGKLMRRRLCPRRPAQARTLKGMSSKDQLAVLIRLMRLLRIPESSPARV
jgi:hypothetical protein